MERFGLILQKEVDEQASDPDGYFIERYKNEIDKNDKKPSSSFHKNDGYLNLLTGLGDIFGAGKI